MHTPLWYSKTKTIAMMNTVAHLLNMRYPALSPPLPLCADLEGEVAPDSVVAGAMAMALCCILGHVCAWIRQNSRAEDRPSDIRETNRKQRWLIAFKKTNKTHKRFKWTLFNVDKTKQSTFSAYIPFNKVTDGQTDTKHGKAERLESMSLPMDRVEMLPPSWRSSFEKQI